MYKQLSILLAAFALSLSAHAALIDFTDSTWKDAIDGNNLTSVTVGNITLESTGGYLTFNSSSGERAGCSAGQPDNNLSCLGDGLGVGSSNPDEITQNSTQSITVTFAEAVNVNDILLLDLFSSEQSGERAVINGEQYYGDNLLAGGFYATGFTGNNIYSLLFTGNIDSFSDYALAGIDVELSPVPVPGAAILFGSALLGFFGFKRRKIA